MSPTSRTFRWFLSVMLVAGLLGAAQVGGNLAPSGVRMTTAAKRFLDTLNADQRKVAQFPYDSPERIAWSFVPLQDRNHQPLRKGLRLELMNGVQKLAALDLLHTGLSEKGYQRATTIMSLETVLADAEKGRGPVRNPGWYFVTIFGTPSAVDPWGWRIDGHHLSLNFSLIGAKVNCVTPAFFGSNPGEVKEGNRKGTRPLAGTLDFAVDLVKTLSDEQRSKCLVPPFGEVQGRTAAAKVGMPSGIPYGELKAGQQDALRKLLGAYLSNLDEALAAAERSRIEAAGYDRLAFGFSGSVNPGDAVTYRVQGPNLLVEFNNVQPDSAGNKNNHYHTSWRTLPSDFGK